MSKMFRLAAMFMVTLAVDASAQQVPLPPLIKIIVPFAAGASTDAAARAVATELSKRTGSNVIVDNQPGASTFLGVAAAAKAPKDGSVLLMTSSSTITAAATKPTVPIDITTEMLPVAQLSSGPLIIAASIQSNIKTPEDLVTAARARPDQITHGTGGIGTLAHVAAEMINQAGKISLMHVPYKGAALAVPDLIAGRIDLMIGVYTTVAPHVKSGRARLVAVTTPQPQAAFPGIPTMASVVPGLSIDIWVGFFAPLGTPPAVIRRLNAELNEVAKTKAVLDVIEPDGSVRQAITAEEFGARVASGYLAWRKLASEKKIVAD
jgi:tripartite-type tricarboxylate transporter receptor subunit TctC